MRASLSPGWMHGRYISGFGEGWLIMKTKGALQLKAIVRTTLC